MQQRIQFSLWKLLTAVTVACCLFATAGWVGGATLVMLAVWSLWLLLVTAPIYAFALSVVTMTTDGVPIKHRRLVQLGIFVLCLPLGALALVGAMSLLR